MVKLITPTKASFQKAQKKTNVHEKYFKHVYFQVNELIGMKTKTLTTVQQRPNHTQIQFFKFTVVRIVCSVYNQSENNKIHKTAGEGAISL